MRHGLSSKSARKNPNSQVGFTLIEIMIGLMIMMIVTAGVGKLIIDAFASTALDTFRVNDISQAQKISGGLDQLLTGAACVDSSSQLVVGWSAGSYDSYCNGPPNQIVVAGNSTSFTFFSPETTPINTPGVPPTAPSANIYTEFLVSEVPNTVRGVNVDYVTVEDLRTGGITYLGNYVKAGTLSFTYYPYTTTPSPASQCAGSGSLAPNTGPNPNPALNVSVAVSMRMTMQEAYKDTSGTTYSTCIYLPGSN